MKRFFIRLDLKFKNAETKFSTVFAIAIFERISNYTVYKDKKYQQFAKQLSWRYSTWTFKTIIILFLSRKTFLFNKAKKIISEVRCLSNCVNTNITHAKLVEEVRKTSSFPPQNNCFYYKKFKKVLLIYILFHILIDFGVGKE